MKPKTQTLTFSALLILLGVLVFGQVYQYEFVQYDDPAYITNNKYVNKGITVDGLKWAILHQETGAPLKHKGVNNLYHPLSLISHMIDVQCFELNAGAHHIMNLVIHLISTVFAFLFIKSLTRSQWVGFIAASLFLLHPTHVESVAWLSERKDTLSGLFFWASLYFYFSKKNQKTAFICLILGLLAKPSIVVLPIILVLIICSQSSKKFTFSNLVKHSKLHWHWFAAAVLFAAINLYTQGAGSHAFFSGESSLLARISTAGTGYWFYLYRTLIPIDLSIAYTAPAIGKFHYIILAGTVAFLILAWIYRNAFPNIFLAIAWFTICWLPVSGLTYIGIEFTADRYLYLSLGGFFILISQYLDKTTLTKAASVAIILVCTFLSFNQTKVWKNTLTLFTHATTAQPNNTLGWTNLGAQYQILGQYEKAIECHKKVISRAKMDYVSQHNLGICNLALKKTAEAKSHFIDALVAYPAYHPSLMQLAKLNQKARSVAGLRELSQLVNKAHQISPKDRKILQLKTDIDRILKSLPR